MPERLTIIPDSEKKPKQTESELQEYDYADAVLRREQFYELADYDIGAPAMELVQTQQKRDKASLIVPELEGNPLTAQGLSPDKERHSAEVTALNRFYAGLFRYYLDHYRHGGGFLTDVTNNDFIWQDEENGQPKVYMNKADARFVGGRKYEILSQLNYTELFNNLDNVIGQMKNTEQRLGIRLDGARTALETQLKSLSAEKDLDRIAKAFINRFLKSVNF